MTIGENIRRLRREAGLSQEELAEIANVTNKAVSSWEIGGRTPRLGALRRIADYFHVPVAELLAMDEAAKSRIQVGRAEPLSWRDESPTLSTNFLRAPNVRGSLPAASVDRLASAYAAADAPTRDLICRALGIESLPLYTPDDQTVDLIVYDSPASAGQPLYVESGYERVSFARNSIPRGADFGVRIFGDSMEPTLRSGAIVFVHKQETILPGQVGIFTVDGDAACKRYGTSHAGGRPVLLSDNPKYAPIDATTPDVRVLGVVVGSA